MNHEQRPILIVLDTSAILAYTRGSIHVGEPMAEVDNDGGVVGLRSRAWQRPVGW